MQPTLPPAATAFLQRLRLETAPMHRQLEQGPLSSALMQQAVTIDQYARYLSRMRNVIAWCEESVFPLAEPVLPLQERRKLALADNDLSFLRTVPAAMAFNAPCLDEGIAAALGCLYVIEGSTLGGKVILKHTGARLPIDAENGGSFFHGYGEETGRQWTHFLENFASHITDIHGEDAAIRSAQCLFSSIDHYFRQ